MRGHRYDGFQDIEIASAISHGCQVMQLRCGQGAHLIGIGFCCNGSMLHSIIGLRKSKPDQVAWSCGVIDGSPGRGNAALRAVR